MIQVKISCACKSAVSKTQVAKIHNQIQKKSERRSDFLDWVDWPHTLPEKEISDIITTANKMRAKAEYLLVIGIGGSYLGVRTGIEFVQGLFPNTKHKIIFAGQTMSPDYIYQVKEFLKDKSFAINVISKSGTTLEPALSFRIFKEMLEKKHGKKYNDYIIATTDGSKGVLKDLANVEQLKTFTVPDGIGGRYSVLTPVGLFPFAFVGIDIKKMLSGAKKSADDTKTVNNSAYKYALLRHHLYTNKKFTTELLCSYEAQMVTFGEWWKQLFGESEGKQDKGLFPASCTFTTDLHSLGQFIQEGKKTFFQTSIIFKKSNYDISIQKNKLDSDKLNWLAGKTMHHINTAAATGVLKAHSTVNPNITIELEKMDDYNFGYLAQWFFKACAMSAYLLGVDPFNQPGVELYKKEMFSLLKK